MASWAWVGRMHRSIYLKTGGRLGARLAGLDMCLLTTRGRRTGEARTTPLSCFPRGDVIVIVASNAGQDRHPAWWLNLLANPEAHVRLGREAWPIRAREANAEERETLWPWLVERNPPYAKYADKTTRRIPVVLLERAAARRMTQDGVFGHPTTQRSREAGSAARRPTQDGVLGFRLFVANEAVGFVS